MVNFWLRKWDSSKKIRALTVCMAGLDMLGNLSPSVDCGGKTLWFNKADWHLVVGR